MPNMAQNDSLETLFDISEALAIAPIDLLRASISPRCISQHAGTQEIIRNAAHSKIIAFSPFYTGNAAMRRCPYI